MRTALVIDGYDDVSAVRVTDLPLDEPEPGQVQIAVGAASIGPVDLYTTRGAFAGWVKQLGLDVAFPLTIGWDVAGTVTAAGDGTDLLPGTRVLAMNVQPTNSIGVHADHVNLPASACARIPDGVDDVSAATIPCCGLTARLALAALAPDGRPDSAPDGGPPFLVVGATGQLGGFVTQLATAAGHLVIASVSPSAFDDARALGAQYVIDRTGDLAEQVHAIAPAGVAAAFDPIGGDVTASLAPAIADGGRYVTSVSWAGSIDERSISTETLFVAEDGAALGQLAGQLAAGVITARIAEVVPLREGRRAYELVARGAPGKVVLDPSA